MTIGREDFDALAGFVARQAATVTSSTRPARQLAGLIKRAMRGMGLPVNNITLSAAAAFLPALITSRTGGGIGQEVGQEALQVLLLETPEARKGDGAPAATVIVALQQLPVLPMDRERFYRLAPAADAPPGRWGTFLTHCQKAEIAPSELHAFLAMQITDADLFGRLADRLGFEKPEPSPTAGIEAALETARKQADRLLPDAHQIAQDAAAWSNARAAAHLEYATYRDGGNVALQAPRAWPPTLLRIAWAIQRRFPRFGAWVRRRFF